MKAKYSKLFSMLSCFVLAAAVYIGVQPACPGTMYQPKVPKHLA